MSDFVADPQLVLIHGLFSSPMEFAMISRALRARGVAFSCLTVPGYTAGSTSLDLSWHRWVDAAETALDARYGPDTPIVLGGLCSGGAVAAALALRKRQQDIRAVVLLSPTFRYDGWAMRGRVRFRRLAYALGIDRWFSMPEREPFGIKNPKIRARVLDEISQGRESSFGPPRLSLRGIRETERLYASVLGGLSALGAPLFVLHAREDEIASLAGLTEALASAGVEPELTVLENSYHMITIDNDRHVVAERLADLCTTAASACHRVAHVAIPRPLVPISAGQALRGMPVSAKAGPPDLPLNFPKDTHDYV